MKVEQLNKVDWTKPQVVVGNYKKIQICTNLEELSLKTFSGIDIETGEFSKNWSKGLFKPETATQYPIELKLTIESDEELCDLWHRANISDLAVMKYSPDSLKHKASFDKTLYDSLNELVVKHNLHLNKKD